MLMAKAGLAVPAAPPVRLPPFSAVLADIGDEQSLSASLSTFSGHLRRTQARPAGSGASAQERSRQGVGLRDGKQCLHKVITRSHIQRPPARIRRRALQGGGLPFLGCLSREAGRALQPNVGALEQALRREADGRALVLLDEVGTGTDPAEGAALGAALLRALAADGVRSAAFTLATTHHRCARGVFTCGTPCC